MFKNKINIVEITDDNIFSADPEKGRESEMT